MKGNVILVLIILVGITSLQAQERSDIFDPKTNITWLGLDFTSSKLIGDRERYGSESDIRHLLEAWNDLMIKESDKFNIAKATDRKTVTNNIEVTKEHNAELDVLSMYSDNGKDYLHLNREGIDEIIAGYDFKELTGLGLIFNIESFSKLNGEASVWITFINLGTKEVLFTERMIGHPGGAGMRNYWANAVGEIIERIIKKEFEMWRKNKS